MSQCINVKYRDIQATIDIKDMSKFMHVQEKIEQLYSKEFPDLIALRVQLWDRDQQIKSFSQLKGLPEEYFNEENGPVLTIELAPIPGRTSSETPNIIDRAFPPLGRRQLYRRKISQTRKESVYKIVPNVQEGTFGILQEFKRERLTSNATSLLWTEARKGTLYNWSGEVDIQHYVKTALIDCLEVANFEENLEVYLLQTFSVAQIMGHESDNIADVTVLVKDNSIAGVVQVKLPESNMDDIYQIVDYMIDLRNHYNVRYVFGVYTTYEEWKILWFEDSNAAAECTSKDEYDEMCLAGTANEYTVEKGTINVYQSKLYKFNDPELIECLATLLYKVSKTPIYTPTGFIDDCSRYVYATPTSIEYKLLPKTVEKFKYSMPPKNTLNFYILSNFQCGRDGFVALVCSTSGHLSVVKFLHPSETNEKEALEDERNHWKTLWQVDCRIIVLNGRLGLLMPFCMVFNPYHLKPFPFSSLQSWNKILSNVNDYELVSEELEECINRDQLIMYQKDPLMAAEHALSILVQASYCHLDLTLRHIALLPKWNEETKLYNFQPILIDLTRVESNLDPIVAQSRAAEGLETLKKELEEMKQNSMDD